MKPGEVTDLNALWDPAAGRAAWVTVSEGRLEIVLYGHDPEWVSTALDVIHGHKTDIVIACPPTP